MTAPKAVLVVRCARHAKGSQPKIGTVYLAPGVGFVWRPVADPAVVELRSVPYLEPGVPAITPDDFTTIDELVPGVSVGAYCIDRRHREMWIPTDELIDAARSAIAARSTRPPSHPTNGGGVPPEL